MSDQIAAPARGVPNAHLRPRRKRRRDWKGLLYVAPALALVLVFFLLPLCMTAWMSLHNWPLLGLPRWIGFGNYKALWSDRNFWNALCLHHPLHHRCDDRTSGSRFIAGAPGRKGPALLRRLPHSLLHAGGHRFCLGKVYYGAGFPMSIPAFFLRLPKSWD